MAKKKEINIQIVLMDGRKFINHYQNFPLNQQRQAIEFIQNGLLDPSTSIIEISKWYDRQLPSIKERV